MRKLGEMLAAPGGVSRGQPQKNCTTPRTILSEMGIDRNLSSRAQRIASVSEDKFEAAIATASNMVKNAMACIKSGSLLEYHPNKFPTVRSLTEPIDFPNKYHAADFTPPLTWQQQEANRREIRR